MPDLDERDPGRNYWNSYLVGENVMFVELTATAICDQLYIEENISYIAF
jgi:hypothetical protein